MNNKEKIALFAGTFDPYTKGHHAIVQRALQLFDKVVVAVGRNMEKRSMLPPEQRLAQIEKTYANEPRVQAALYDGLTVDYARKVGATALLRGVRSVKDFEYERDLADINMRIDGMETVILISAPEYAVVSSSLVRELAAHGKDVSDFLP